MQIENKATRIELFNLKTPQMRAFHMSWFSFFLCFFAWFGIAPLMAIVRDELSLTQAQIGNTIIASVAITIVARLVIGVLCDRVGPRISYTILMIVGSLPVMGIGLAHSYESFLLFRLGIGVIGASFVITQYHTSVMFAPNCVGTANATSAGWGNLGGGVTQMVMPLVLAGFVGLGYTEVISWRLAMVVAGAVCFVTGIAYFFLTQDLPNGNFKDLRARGEMPEKIKTKGTFILAAKDPRVWSLFLVYGACFGIELTINNIAALYFIDYFGLGLATAGLVAGLFGLMNIFARTTGGIIGDKFGHTGGLKGRVRWLFIAILVEGIALMAFSRMDALPVAIGSMVIFSMFTQMSEGATYSVVPFINKKALGSVSGIVGAGGNMGAVGAGFLFKSEAITWPTALLILGAIVTVVSFFALTVRFSEADEKTAAAEHAGALADRARTQKKPRFALPSPAPTARRLSPISLLRVYLGIALAIKAIFYITNMGDLEAQMGERFGSNQELLAWFIVLVHGAGGVALALGFGTRWAAGLNALVLAGAVTLHLAGTTSIAMAGQDVSVQFAALVLAILLLFVWQGADKFSLDRWIRSDDQPSAG
ncbi:MAG: NNP family nitrate/nitrite transporter-like MFS transporter [Planctomycetota bacterium]|jgi:NNP family nitrate/nitrite transporter-like MFS transporter